MSNTRFSNRAQLIRIEAPGACAQSAACAVGAVEVCFDTKKRQGVALPEDVKAKLQAAAQR